MYLIFVDECGYVKDWNNEARISEQPFYVLSAVAIPATQIPSVYNRIRQGIKELSPPCMDPDKLGRGEEIKAKSVDRGEGFWSDPAPRNCVRELYLNQQVAIYFVVSVDKQRLRKQYTSPEDPSQLAAKFLFERLQGFLREQNAQGFVLVDKNKREEPEQQEYTAQLLTEGSGGIAYSELYRTFYGWRLEFTNILEMHFGDSRHSLGLQIADFVARHAYSWRKEDKRSDYPGWSLIEPRLYKYPSYKGWGYKEFPKMR